MSAAAVADASPPKKGKKKLMIIGAVVALLLAGGGGAFVMMKSKAAAEEGDDAYASETGKKHVAPARDPKAAPAFLPLDTFTVNLADRNADRFAQVGLTLEFDDPQVAELGKADMPAVRPFHGDGLRCGGDLHRQRQCDLRDRRCRRHFVASAYRR